MRRKELQIAYKDKVGVEWHQNHEYLFYLKQSLLPLFQLKNTGLIPWQAQSNVLKCK